MMIMPENMKTKSNVSDNSMKITVIKNGPYIAIVRVPLIISEIRNDEEGYRRSWREVKRYPVQEQYALCRCGHSDNKVFCDGTHAKIHFDGTEAGDYEPYIESAKVIPGSMLTLTDNKHLCVHTGFCMREGSIWNLVRQSENPEAGDTAIEEACNCPSGRLVILDNVTGKAIEPELEKSIVFVEYPPPQHSPFWIRGGIPIESADGKQYEIRNRVTLCGCGKSRNKPFCDGSHVKR